MRTGFVNEMIKYADVLEIISPVTGSSCRLGVDCSEAIALVRGGKQGRLFKRRGDLIKDDSDLKERNALCIYPQEPITSLCQTSRDYVTPKISLFGHCPALTRDFPKLSQTPTTCLRKYFRPRGVI